MTETEIKQMLAQGERLTLECKKAKTELPKSVWESYSAFANTIGGYILLGIDENRKETDVAKRFTIIGVDNIPKLISDLWNTINSNKVNRNILLDSDVEEVDMLEGAIDLEKWEGQRNKAIIETLFSCGLRVSELVNLKKSDVFEEEKFIRIIGKGNKERIVPISGKALKEINLWYIDRNLMTIKPGEEDYVFLNRRGAHLTRNMILIMIKNAAYDAGIKKTISPHTLRHSFATALLKGGADLRVIQALLGHEDIGTTEIYTHLETSDLRRAILEHHPRNIKYSEENQVLDSDKTDKRCPNNR